jgi:hypothetical protein
MTERIILDIRSSLKPTAFVEDLLKEFNTQNWLIVLNGTCDMVSKYLTQYDKYIALYLIESDNKESLTVHTGPSDTMSIRDFQEIKYMCLVALINKTSVNKKIIYDDLKKQIN